MAIVGRSPSERQAAFKVERGWTSLPLHCDVIGAFSHPSITY
jgi:hypothetical protein